MSFKEDITRPFNLFTIVFSIALSAFFYFNSKKVKSISYHIDEPPSLIYDSHNSSSAIQVIQKDNTVIKSNVYLITGLIWNSGDLPITKEDVRQNIVLKLHSATKILDFKIIKQTDPTIARFNLLSQANNLLVLDWKYFDPNYGFKFQIIYIGSNDSQFDLTGKILDVDGFKKIKTLSNTKFDNVTKIMSIITIPFFLFAIYFFNRKISSQNISDSRIKFIKASIILFIIDIIIAVLLLIILSMKSQIPLPLI